MDEGGNFQLIASLLVVSFFLLISFFVLRYILNLLQGEKEPASIQNEQLSEPTDKKQKEIVQRKAKKKTRVVKQDFKHVLLYSTLKCVKGEVCDMDYSNNGKYLATCSNDNTVLIWDAKDLSNKNHKSMRVNIEFDFATFVKWSPDNTAFIINKSVGNNIEVFKIDKKEKDRWIGPISKVLSFPNIHSEGVIGMGIASNGKYIMSCSKNNDLAILDLKGHILAKTDTYTLTALCAKISPCGKFVVASGWSPDVKVWEVIFDRSGEFKELKRVFELTGHTSGISDVAFDVDTSHMATVSKDGTWKLYDTKIDYKRGESPHLLKTGKYEPISEHAHIALSPSANVIAVATNNSVRLYSAFNAQLDYVISDIFEEPEDQITRIMFDASSKYVLVSGSNKVHVFHNVTGYSCEINEAKDKLKHSQTSAMKERLQKLIKGNEEFLDSVQKKEVDED